MKLGAAVESLLRQFSDGIVVTDPDGRITWVNAAFTRMSGYTLDDVRGQKPSVVLQGAETDPAMVHRIHDAIAARRAVEAELVNYHRDGHPYCVHLTIQPIRDGRAKLQGFIAVERDTTATRREMAALEEEVCRLYRMLVDVVGEDAPRGGRRAATVRSRE